MIIHEEGFTACFNKLNFNFTQTIIKVSCLVLRKQRRENQHLTIIKLKMRPKIFTNKNEMKKRKFVFFPIHSLRNQPEAYFSKHIFVTFLL